MSNVKQGRRMELAHFLRSRRERLMPTQVGLPSTGRRRTPGLRRGEVALLAGVSLEWYTYLEQGRDIRVSVEFLDTLSEALKLNDAERRHLFLLSRQQEPLERLRAQTLITPELQRFLDALGTSPGCLIDARMNVVAWNHSFTAVFGDLSHRSEQERNMLWATFASDEFRLLQAEGWEEAAKTMIAHFRAGYAKHVDDPWWAEQIDVLSKRNMDFQTLWNLHDVVQVPNMSKRIHHPTVGILEFDYIVLHSPETPDLQVSIHLPKDDGMTEGKIRGLLGMEKSQ